MKSGKQKLIHLICNAHLDPVWLWEWQEGAAEAISTFRTAAELCEQDEIFVFNHNEVTLYKWVQEYEPSLFKRIQKLVKKGRWHIMGGWYLQPDCNMPSGESFVRQILLGKTYFKKHFGVEPRTAINFDPFGHTRGLVQILAKSGYDSYLFGRPRVNDKECELEGEDFVWVGYDGSEVLAARFPGWYNTPLGKAAELISERMQIESGRNPMVILWGVGNHGGGPSKLDLKDVNKLIQETADFDVKHSTPEAYFRQLKKIKDKLPCRKNDINPWAVGCYTSDIRIKQKHRLLENELYALEKIASAASAQGLMKYPYEQIHEVMCDLMVIEFHDILPGSSIQPAEEAALQQIDHGLEIAGRLMTKAFFALASGQKKAKDGEIPVLVYNHHPFVVKQLVECEFNLPDFRSKDDFVQVGVFDKSKKLSCQVEQELSCIFNQWRKRIVFATELQPGMNRFDCRLKVIKKKPAPILKTKNGKIVFKTKELEVVINSRTGFVDRYRIKGKDFVNNNAFIPVIVADNADPWGITTNSFRKVIGRFKLMSKQAGSEYSGVDKLIDSVRVIEDGPTRSVVEAVFSYGKSFICQRYKLPKSGTEIEVEMKVYWNEIDKMLKLSVPTTSADSKYLGQVAYGVQQLPDNGNEAVAQKWVAVISDKDNAALTCINDGIYGSDFSKDGLSLSLLRSPVYSAHPDDDGEIFLPQDRYSPRIDHGARHFNFWFNGGRVKERLRKIDREALVKNEKPFALSFFPNGNGKKTKPIAVLDDDAVQITAIKRAESNNDLIIRLFEPTGKARKVTLTMPVIGKKRKITLQGFEIKTLRLSSKNGNLTCVDLLERKVKQK